MPFSQLGLNTTLVQAVREMRFTEATPIQAKAIPLLIQGLERELGLAER